MRMIIAIAFILCIAYAIYLEAFTAVWEEYVSFGNKYEFRCSSCGHKAHTVFTIEGCHNVVRLPMTLPRKCPSCGRRMRKIRQ